MKCIMLQLCNIHPIELPRKPEMSRTAPLESVLPQAQLSPDVAVLQDIPAPHLRCLPCACLSTAEFAAWEGFGRVVFVLRVSVAVSWGPRICSTLVQISVLHEIAIVTLSQIPSDRTWPLLVCKGSSPFSFPSFFFPSFPSHMCLCLECQPHIRRTGEVSASLWVFYCQCFSEPQICVPGVLWYPEQEQRLAWFLLLYLKAMRPGTPLNTRSSRTTISFFSCVLLGEVRSFFLIFLCRRAGKCESSK